MSKWATYQRIARWYDFLNSPFERNRYRPIRPLIFEGLNGRILDAGVGTGSNIPHYPVDAEMVGSDISAAMLARANRRQEETCQDIALHEMNVMNLSFDDNSFDAVVSTFLFCVLEPQNQLPALKELARDCKSDGELRLLEYSYSKNPRKHFIMKLWAPWVRFAYGAAFDRNTHHYMEEAGWSEVDNRFLFEDIVRLIIARPLVRD